MTSPLHSTIFPVLTPSPVAEADLKLRKRNTDEWGPSKSGTGLTSTLPADMLGTSALLWFKRKKSSSSIKVYVLENQHSEFPVFPI